MDTLGFMMAFRFPFSTVYMSTIKSYLRSKPSLHACIPSDKEEQARRQAKGTHPCNTGESERELFGHTGVQIYVQVLMQQGSHEHYNISVA